jgi:hypothetical protein
MPNNKNVPISQPAADSMSPTSGLPFAARICDVPYLDYLENWRYKVVKKLSPQKEGQYARDEEFANLMAQFADRMSKVGHLLESIEEYMKIAQRGGGPDHASPELIFARGYSLLVLTRDLVENYVMDADVALEAFCTPKGDQL